MPSRVRWMLACLAVALIASFAAAPAPARADVKGEINAWLKDAEEKLVELSEAMPEKKYAWTPSKGVRTVGEVYMHVATANFGLPTLMGQKAPEGFDFRTYEKSLTKKDDIRKALKDSFAHARSALDGMSDADFDQEFEFFGTKMTKRSGFMLLMSHAHEHLGQSIAYARSSGITPPWTAREQAAMKATKEKEASKEAASNK